MNGCKLYRTGEKGHEALLTQIGMQGNVSPGDDSLILNSRANGIIVFDLPDGPRGQVFILQVRIKCIGRFDSGKSTHRLAGASKLKKRCLAYKFVPDTAEVGC